MYPISLIQDSDFQSHPEGYTMLRIVSPAVLCVLVTLTVLFLGCGTSDAPSLQSAHDQFREISNTKKVRLEQFLRARDSQLYEYEATVTSEDNVEQSVRFPYVGRITFEYRISEIEETANSDGVTRWYETDELIARYRYSSRNEGWVYEGATRGDTEFFNAIPADQKLITFDEVRSVFEDEG